jgi:hypothetical protein
LWKAKIKFNKELFPTSTSHKGTRDGVWQRRGPPRLVLVEYSAVCCVWLRKKTGPTAAAHKVLFGCRSPREQPESGEAL